MDIKINNLAKLLNYFFIFFVISFFPSFVLGISYVNYLIAFFLLISLLFYFEEIKKIAIENKIFSILFSFFYFCLLVSSMLSDYIFFSLQSSLLYFLYLLYIFSIVRLFNDRKFQIIFYFSGLLIFLIISLDGFYEIFNGSNTIGNFAIPGRLSGFFGERWVIGSFLVRFLPILVAIFFLNYSSFSKMTKKFSLFVTVISVIIIIFSGERTAYLLLLLYTFFNLIFISKYFNPKKFFIIIFFIVSLFIIPFFITDFQTRLTDKILFYLTTFNFEDNQYLTLYSTAIKIFISNPIFGAGPNTFRYLCSDEIYYIAYFSCSTHPHNIFLQVLSETGVLGTTIIYSVFIFCLLKIFKILRYSKSNAQIFGYYSLFISVIMNLFPLVPSGNFFLSYNGFIFTLPFAIYFSFKNKQIIK